MSPFPPDPLLATLEIMAEQQPWDRFCPYEVVEGQHVRLEMFVGRMREAERLAFQANYGRIFSGRRLGKTALLRFVEGHPRFRRLPSGNELHIVFCSIAGEDSEAAVSRSIIKSVHEHLGDRANGDIVEIDDPVAHLKRWIPALLDEHPDRSWLILLDEADSFFEAQINSGTADQQKTLSWWMSRHSEKLTDSGRVPRIRFVFCGYLRTDQNRGVWENKGDVLLLRPLEPRDAIELAAAPLARIGIDARNQAHSIAFQCGYQPSVLVRFGLTMVEHLHRTTPRQGREGVEVRPKDVHDVFMSNGVQQAIEEACWLNFVGHPTRQLVFAAILMDLRDRVSFAAVDDLPPLVLERIKQASPDFDPSAYFKEAWDDIVSQQLRELVDRSLLVQVGHRPSTWRDRKHEADRGYRNPAGGCHGHPRCHRAVPRDARRALQATAGSAAVGGGPRADRCNDSSTSSVAGGMTAAAPAPARPTGPRAPHATVPCWPGVAEPERPGVRRARFGTARWLRCHRTKAA